MTAAAQSPAKLTRLDQAEILELFREQGLQVHRLNNARFTFKNLNSPLETQKGTWIFVSKDNYTDERVIEIANAINNIASKGTTEAISQMGNFLENTFNLKGRLFIPGEALTAEKQATALAELAKKLKLGL